jgi:hypothetical protein
MPLLHSPGQRRTQDSYPWGKILQQNYKDREEDKIILLVLGQVTQTLQAQLNQVLMQGQ